MELSYQSFFWISIRKMKKNEFAADYLYKNSASLFIFLYLASCKNKKEDLGLDNGFGPHNFSAIPNGPSEDMAWSFYSEKEDKVVNIDMMRVVRLLEGLTGEQLVFIQNK
jgi:hypothetical protein